MHDETQIGEKLESVAARFRDTWRTDERPRLTEWLEQHPHFDRSALLRRLLLVELNLRSTVGEQPTAADYVNLLPEDADTIREVFAAIDETGLAAEGSTDADTVTFTGTTADNEPPAGTLGDFELQERIGRGGMGVVYRARQISLNRMVALKTIRAADVADTDEEVQRFRAEAEAAASLKHPGIVPVYQFGQAEGQWFLAMELVEGGSLSDLLRDGPLEPKRAATLLRQIAEAVAAAHSAGVVHRDLKPANVLLNEHGQPRVTDFGLAKRTSVDSGMTATGQILGTPSYMPPEQARGEVDAVGPLADVYALGAILYCLLTGRPPFQAANVMETLKQVLDREPVPPSQLNPAVPRDLQTICLKCLEKEARVRYRTASELADELGRYLNNEPISARPVGPVERGWRWCRRHPSVSGMYASGFIALLALVGFLIGLSSQERLRKSNRELEVAFGEADSAKRVAESARDAEAQAKAALDNRLYARRVNLALLAWQDGEVARARQLLEECPAGYRRWEWHYVHRVCHPELLTIRAARFNVLDVAFSPDGTRFASAGADNAIHMWDSRGRLLFTMQGPADGGINGIGDFEFSPDGKWLASGNHNGTLRIWDAGTGAVQITFPAHDGFVRDVAFSPDGTRIVSAGNDSLVRIWDVATGRELSTFRGHTGQVASVAVSPDGSRVASGSGDNIVKVWDIDSRQEAFTLEGHENSVICLAFSPDGTRLASGSLDRTVKVWDAVAGEEVLTKTGHTHEVTSVVFSPNGESVASTGWKNTAKVWDAASGEDRLTLQGHIRGFTSLAFSPDGQRILSGGEGESGTVKLWDFSRIQNVLTLTGHASPPNAPRKAGFMPGTVVDLAFSPDGGQLASASNDKTVKIWDATSGRELLTYRGHRWPVLSMAISPDGTRVASGSIDGQVKIWEAASGRELVTLETSRPKALAFSPDGRRLAGAGSDSRVRIWDPLTGKEVSTIETHGHMVNDFSFSPDGSQIATAGEDGDVKLWDASSGRNLATLSGGPRFSVSSPNLAFSPDGKSLASAGYDTEIKLWDLSRRQVILTLGGHAGAVTSVSFTPDGDRLASSSWDGTVRLWDTASGDEMMTLDDNGPAIRCIAFDPTGNRLAAAAGTTVKIWDATSAARETQNAEDSKTPGTEDSH